MNQSDLELALHMADEVKALSMKWFSSVDLKAISKADGSPVTQADLAVEQRLRELIAEHRPDDAILGEEEGATSGTSGRRWVLDPIDGTSAFARGVPLWATLIALFDEDGPSVGVIAQPAMDETIAAAKGQGATRNGEPCRVSTIDTFDNAVVSTWGYEKWPPELLGKFQAKGPAMRGWSDAYGWASLATGRVDVMVDPSAKLWDVAPMMTIIPEAGGQITTIGGDEIAFDYIIGSNGVLQDEAMELFQ